MLSHAQLLIEAGQQCFIGCKLAFRYDHIAIGDGARQALLAHQLHILLININNVLDGLQLSADGSALNGLRHRISRQTQICCVQFIALVIGQCRFLLDMSTRSTE